MLLILIIMIKICPMTPVPDFRRVATLKHVLLFTLGQELSYTAKLVAVNMTECLTVMTTAILFISVH